MSEILATRPVSTDESLPWMPVRGRSLAVRERQFLLAVFDSALLAALAAVLTIFGVGPGGFFSLALPMLGAWLVVGYFAGIYELRTAARLRTCLSALLQTGLVVCGAMLLYDFLQPHEVSRTSIFEIVFVGQILVAGWRLLYGRLVAGAQFERRIVVVGSGVACYSLLRAIDENEGHGVRVVGVLDDDPGRRGAVVAGMPVLGDTSAIWPIAVDYGIEEVVLATDRPVNDTLAAEVGICYEHGITVSLMPHVYGEVTGQVPVENMGNHWVGAVPLRRTGGSLFYAVKRGMDILVSAVGLILSLPVMAVVAVLVRLSSPGPIFFLQSRVGLHGRGFTIAKFRSMYIDRPEASPIGRWLRRAHLDELPQLWNVLVGDMSLVGPRPKRFDEARQLEERIPLYRVRQSVRPGLTGWAQIRYGYAHDHDGEMAKLRYDLYYIQHQTLLLDIAIIVKTVAQVLLRKGF